MTPLPLPDAAAVWARPGWPQSRWVAECGCNHKTIARREGKMGFARNSRGKILRGPCVACGWPRLVEELDERHRCLRGCHAGTVHTEAEDRPLDADRARCREEMAAFLQRPAGQRARALEHALEVRDKMQGETMHLSGRAA